MAKWIGLPRLSPTMEEGTLIEWIKKEGEYVEVDDLLAEIETDKAVVEFRSFDRGFLLKIIAEPGSVLKPDEPVAILGEQDEDVRGILLELSLRKENEEASVFSKGERSSLISNDTSSSKDKSFRASPFVRKMARQHEIDLTKISPSGPHGRVIKRDIIHLLHHKTDKQRQSSVALTPNSIQSTIARKMVESKHQVPHFYLSIDVDAGSLSKIKQEVYKMAETKLSINDFIIKAAALALEHVPACNVSWIDGKIYQHQVVDISVALASPNGLVTPIIRDANVKSVFAISNEMKAFVKRAANKQRFRPDEIGAGTLGISNLGMKGIDRFQGIIQPPESALLAVGRIREVPVAQDQVVKVGKQMNVTLSSDHRALDGVAAADFLHAFKEMIESPLAMLVDIDV